MEKDKKRIEEIYSTVKDFNFDDEIIAIEELDDGDLIDIEVDDNNLFFANGILTKNSVGVPATADFMIILGLNEDDLVYKSEVHYKIAKNRFGGRVDEIGKFYTDQKTLKLYDSSEMDEWKSDANVTEDDLYRRRTQQRQPRGRTV